MIFTRYGRIIPFLAVLTSLLIVFLRKKKIVNIKLLALLLLQTILFLLFSAVNFYTQRYMLVLMGLFMIASGVLLVQARFKNIVLNVGIVVVLLAVPAIYSFTKKSNADSDLGYVETVKVQQQMARYCEEQGWQDRPVAASFNMIFALRDPNLGFLSGDKGFSRVTNMGKFREAEIFLNESTFFDHRAELDTVKNENPKIKEFHLDHAWGEIYEKASK